MKRRAIKPPRAGIYHSFSMWKRRRGGMIGLLKHPDAMMNRFSSLDGLRGMAALAVALYHMPIAIRLYESPLIRDAYVAVDFFFVLSGFVIAHAYAHRLNSGEAVRDFVIRRIGRLWPLHISVIAAMVVVEIARLVFVNDLAADIRPPFQGETSLEALFANIFLVHTWGMPASWNIPSWSISAELFAYLAFAAVCLLAPRHARLVAVAIFVVCAAILVYAVGDLPLFHRLDVLKACGGFFTGTLAYAAFARTGRPNWSVAQGTAIEIVTLAAVLGILALFIQPQLGILTAPLFAVLVYVFAAERGLISRLFAIRPLQFLGTISYSIYLTHGLVITAFTAGGRALGKLLDQNFRTPSIELFGLGEAMLVDFGRFWLNDLYALAFVGVVIGLSTLTWRFIELPGQRAFAALAVAHREQRTA